MDAYVVQPADEHTPGETISLQDPATAALDTDTDPLVDWFPDGLSDEGLRWAAMDLREDKQSLAVIREWLVELARRSGYDDHPSRFQSLIGYETRKSARRAAHHRGRAQAYDIFLLTDVTADGPFYARHRSGTTVPEILGTAPAYWEGTPHREGEREYLIRCPVELDDRVMTVDVS